MERIVVGVDGSEPAERALAFALEEAKVRGAELEVVHAWQPAMGGYPYGTIEAFDPAELEAAAKMGLDAVMRGIDATGLAAPPIPTLACGSAASVLIDASKRAAMVVVGSRGRGGFAGLLLGSVSQQVVHHAACPVVVVPGS